MNCIPFFGLRNFHKGYNFEGYCEAFNALMAVISILTTICYQDDNTDCSTKAASSVAAFIAFATVILHIVKIYFMYYIGSVDCYEILIIILSVAIFCCGANSNNGQTHGIILASFITIITVALDAIRDVGIDA